MDAVSKVSPYYQQLLGRGSLVREDRETSSYLSQQRILVTGAGGSVGSALSSILLRLRPRSLTLVEHHENSIFQLRQHLSDQIKESGVPVEFVLADVRDIRTISGVFRSTQPEVIFHLAAYKHVPLAEECPEQFVSVNVVGTWHLCQEALRAGVKQVIYPSTDKAVNPPSVYGATKRSVELLCEALASEQTGEYVGENMRTRFNVARLVNVLGASGGVIESFFDQIQAGNPVRVTDSRMTRYWITMDEALFLLTQATRISGSGKVVLLDMGDPINVEGIARRLWRLVRCEDGQCQIEYIGIRPGERLAEELARDDESLQPTLVSGLLEVSKDRLPTYSLAEAAAYVSLMEQLIGENARERIRQELFAFVRR